MNGRRQHHNPPPYEDFQEKIKSHLEKILDGDMQKLVLWAEKIVKDALLRGRKVTTSQIRNIFGTVKKLEMKASGDLNKVIPELILLKPKLAYVSGRHNDVKGLSVLRDVLSHAIDLVKEKPDPRFFNFCKFFEAILAYHKAEGGR